jgi:hypothetical protein
MWPPSQAPLREYHVWNFSGRSVGQGIGSDWDNMELKQPPTIRFLTDERNQFIMFTKHSINNNITLAQPAKCNVHLITTPTAHHTWFKFIKSASATRGRINKIRSSRSTRSSRTSRSRRISRTSGTI